MKRYEPLSQFGALAVCNNRGGALAYAGGILLYFLAIGVTPLKLVLNIGAGNELSPGFFRGFDIGYGKVATALFQKLQLVGIGRIGRVCRLGLAFVFVYQNGGFAGFAQRAGAGHAAAGAGHTFQ